jgi:hypothetical protein
MSSNFDTSLDSFTDPAATSKLNSPAHSQQHINLNDAVEKIEAKVGVTGSAVTTTHDYKLSGVTGTDKAVSKTGTEVLTNKTLSTGTVITEATMTLGSDADGDIYYRASNKLARLAKGTGLQHLRMNTGATAPEWTTQTINRAFTWYLDGTSIDGVSGATYIAPQNMTVTQTQAKLTSGTCTATLKAGSTTINAISCSSTLATDTSITAPTITAGDLITLTLSSSSSPVGLIITMECSQP